MTHRAPEILLGGTDYTAAVDVWSLGVLLADMYLGTSLFWNYAEEHEADSDDDTEEEVRQTFHNICKCFGLAAMQSLSRYPLHSAYTAETVEFCPLLFQRRGIGLANYLQLRRRTVRRRSSDDLAQLCRPAAIPADAVNLLGRLLAVNPAERWSVAQLLLHPFFQGCVPSEPVVSCPVQRVQLTDFSTPHQTPYDRATVTSFFRHVARRLQWRNSHTLFGALDIAHRYICSSGSYVTVDLISIGAIAENLFEVQARELAEWQEATGVEVAARDIKRAVQRVEFVLKHDLLLATEWMYILAYFHDLAPTKEALHFAEDLLLASLLTQEHSNLGKHIISGRIVNVVRTVFP